MSTVKMCLFGLFQVLMVSLLGFIFFGKEMWAYISTLSFLPKTITYLAMGYKEPTPSLIIPCLIIFIMMYSVLTVSLFPELFKKVLDKVR